MQPPMAKALEVMLPLCKPLNTFNSDTGWQCSIYPQVATQNQFCVALTATPVKYRRTPFFRGLQISRIVQKREFVEIIFTNGIAGSARHHSTIHVNLHALPA